VQGLRVNFIGHTKEADMARTSTKRIIRKDNPRIYRDRHLKEISFPLGGIGTGCIGLAGNGRLIDWEIFNRPNKGSINGFSHFAIRAESEGRLLDARIINGDLHPPYTGNGTGYGFGPSREYLAGLPHFRSVEFLGEYPFATLTFKEASFPGKVTMRAFNPFIPLNDKDSGIPAAIFEIEVKNTTKKSVLYTIAGTLTNTLPGVSSNTISKEDGISSLFMTADFFKPGDTGFGDLCISTEAEDVSFQQYWYRGNWFDSLEIYWKDLSSPGRLANRTYPKELAGGYNHGTVAAHVMVEPGVKRNVRFVISWSFPYCQNYWDANAAELAKKAGIPETWKNYYATIFKDSRESGAYALKNIERLFAETLLFKNALFSSDLPDDALDAVSANLSVLKSPSVMRLEDGTFYGWEGCYCNTGCCEGSCTHVWNYAQALPFLFPGLERSMRTADYRYNQQPNGGMPFRLRLPLGIMHPGGACSAIGADQGGRSCADGLFGNVLKVYRDWKISGDDSWLRELWPAVKKSIEFAWDETNEDAWDKQKTGILQGRQHHTLDMELFGPNSWLTGFYLAALKACAEIAGHLGEASAASEYMSLFRKGKAWADAKLFNGEYYCQLIDLKDKSIPERFGAASEYWDAEHGEIKYQIAQGCDIDQVLAQWHANLYGLGEIFDPLQVKKALVSIFRNNFKKSMRNFPNPCRVYCLNDEKGLVVCEWPEKVFRPAIPLTYSQETQNGYEYASASHMIQRGMIREGMSVVKAVRERYDGEKRNPFNEFECGSNYARSMASYALLNAFSGFSFDMVNGAIGFDPAAARPVERFRCFFSLSSGWGEVFRQGPSTEIRVLYGELAIRHVNLPYLAGKAVKRVECGGENISFVKNKGQISFSRKIAVAANRPLRILTARG
jgi:non-lysosomal glucosylceramidase